MPAAYPLAWPHGVPRATSRAAAQFKTALAPALANVRNSLRRFGDQTGTPVRDVVISSDVTLGVAAPADVGVAVWFTWDGAQRCIAVDRYPKVEHNLQAIHHVLEARITEARHGGLRIVRQTFTGFTALPAPPDVGRSCWDVLGLQPGATAEAVQAAFHARATILHPDRAGGSTAAMAELNAARDAALAELRAKSR